jgi:predicted TPR repeat methyltransferase
MDPAQYGEVWADVYDEIHADTPDREDCVEFVRRLAGNGPVLELAVGTGRIALPLAASGVDVHGIDASEAMVAKLRGKPGGGDIPVHMGNFADVAVDGRYPLILLVFNTLFALATQDEQIRCFANVATRLTGDGAFVIEAFVPDPARFDRGQRVQVGRIGDDFVRLDLARHDLAAQRITSQHVLIRRGGVILYPLEIRYAWPAELDLMARIAGLRLHERWGGWRHEPFGSSSAKHISVYVPA